MGSLFGLFEGLAGESRFGPDLKKYSDAGQPLLQQGTGIEDGAISGFNSDIGSYQDQIRAGGLTPALNSSFDVARAGIMDQGQMQRNGLNASLAQQNLQSGGVMSPQAIAEMKAMGNESIGQNQFAATNTLNENQAQMGFQATQSLMDRIGQARSAVLGAGQNRMGLGADIWQKGLQLRYQRNKAIADNVSSYFGGGHGGGGAAGGFTG